VKKVDALSFATVRRAVPDLALAVLTACAVAAMTPLCFASFDLGKVGHQSGTVASMFALIWLGFVLAALPAVDARVSLHPSDQGALVTLDRRRLAAERHTCADYSSGLTGCSFGRAPQHA
jgi:hypothetical protein